MTPTPSSLRRRTTRNRRWASSSVKRRGWFVERQHLQAAAKSAHDLHELTLSRAEIAGSGPWAEVVLEAKFGEQAPRAAREIGAIEEEPVDAAKIAEEQILRDRQIGNDVRFLMDDPNSKGVGVGGRAERLLNAVRRQSSLVGSIDALEDTHERRLSGAVLAHERENLARARCERHVIERADHPEALRDAERGKSRRPVSLSGSVAALASIAGIAARRLAPRLRRAYL